MKNTRKGNKWKHAKLKELVQFQRGFDITKENQMPGSIPVISSSGINSFHAEAKVDGPGVIIGRKGSLGTVHYSEGPYWPHDTTLWSKELNKNHPRFVYYFLKTLHLERYDVGNSNPTLNRNHIHNLDILLPDFASQEKIAEYLYAYDRLIENNTRRIQLLEQTARLLYKEWFVHFRFPGHEHVKIDDDIPDGWSRMSIGDCCAEMRNAIDPKLLEPSTFYIGLEHMPRKSITLNTWGCSEDVTSTKHLFLEGDILFGKIRPYFHKVGIALINGATSSDSIVVRTHDEKLRSLLLLTMSSDHFIALTSKTMKEGSKMPRADWKQMQQYPISLPPDTLIETFNSFITPIIKQLKSLSFASQRLIQARDLLLPRLMSGELAV